MKSLSSLATLTLLLPSLLQAQTLPTTQPALPPSSYKNTTYHFSLQIPSLTNTTTGPAIFRSPEENGTASNIVFLTQSQKTTRADYLAAGLKSLADDHVIINSQKLLQVAHHDAILLDYQNPPTAKLQTRFLILAVITPDRVHLLTCTATLDNFKKHESDFQNSLSTFTLSDPAHPAPLPTAPVLFTSPSQNFSFAPPPFPSAATHAIPALFRFDEPDNSTTSIAITIEPPSTRKDFTDIMLATLNAQKGTLKSRTELQVNGNDAAILDWEQLPKVGPPHRFLTLKVFAKDHTYSILCTCQSLEYFPAHESQFHQCLNSFQLTPN